MEGGGNDTATMIETYMDGIIIVSKNVFFMCKNMVLTWYMFNKHSNKHSLINIPNFLGMCSKNQHHGIFGTLLV